MLAFSKSIKICHWNVEGLRCNSDDPKLHDPEFLKEICNNDIICLSEIHCSFENDIDIDDFYCFKLCRSKTKKVNRHFGGVAIYYRKAYKNGIKFLEHKNDDYVWMKLSKLFFGLKDDLYLCYSYIPPENSSYYKTRGQDTLYYIEQDIQKFTVKGSILLCGDLNARTGCAPDYIQNDC